MQDLWPDELIFDSKIKAPVTILKEQASLLGKKTKNIVEGLVGVGTPPEFWPSGGESSAQFSYSFYLTAPAINYTYRLFAIAHPIEMYPLLIRFSKEMYSEVTADFPQDLIEKL